MDIATQLRLALAAGRPVCLWGTPGVGKTATVQAVARQLGAHLETVIGSIHEPSDFSGLPVPDGTGGVTLAPPAWARRLVAACADGRPGILFLDEVGDLSPALQAALLRVVHERVVGDLALPPSVMVVAAGNPPECAAQGYATSLPLAGRFGVQLTYPCPSADEWAAWMMAQEDIPLRARALAAGFVRARPALLAEGMSAVAGRMPLAYASPRSHEAAARLIGAILAGGEHPADHLALLAGAVGEPVALEYATWLRSADLPDPEALLAGTATWTPDATRPDIAYAVMASVAAAATAPGHANGAYKRRWEAALPIFERGLALGAEVVVIPARAWAAPDKRPTGAPSPAVIDFVAKIRDVVKAAGVH